MVPLIFSEINSQAQKKLSSRGQNGGDISRYLESPPLHQDKLSMQREGANTLAIHCRVFGFRVPK